MNENEKRIKRKEERGGRKKEEEGRKRKEERGERKKEEEGIKRRKKERGGIRTGVVRQKDEGRIGEGKMQILYTQCTVIKTKGINNRTGG